MAVLETVTGEPGKVKFWRKSLVCNSPGRPHGKRLSYQGQAHVNCAVNNGLSGQCRHPSLLPERERPNGCSACIRGRAFKRFPINPTVWVLFVITLFLATACVIPLQEGKKAEDITPEPPEKATVQEKTSGLIKATIPDTQDTGTDTTTSSVAKPVPVRRSPIEKNKDRSQKWEDQKVKTAARILAKSHPLVKKIQVCYDVKDDEWWAILYDDVGKAYDLKRFVWNRESGEMEPFLVPKQIPKNQFKTHLAKEAAGRACEVIEITKGR